VADLLRHAQGKGGLRRYDGKSDCSREWEVPLRVDLDTISPDDPPLAHYAGCQFDYRGIITISRALELLRSGKPLSDRQEAPYRLARLLLRQMMFILSSVGRSTRTPEPEFGGAPGIKVSKL